MAAAELKIHLPEKVEEQLQAICVEKSVISADAAARKLLSEIGEQESLNILTTIRNSSKVLNLSGFITHMVTKFRNSSSSPLPPFSSPLLPHRNNMVENKRKRDSECPARRAFLFGPPTPAKRVTPDPSVSDLVYPPTAIEEVLPNASKSASDLIYPPTLVPTAIQGVAPNPSKSASDVMYPPTLVRTAIEGVAPNSSKSASDLVLDELHKLDFRKAFLILNYTGGAKLENVVCAEQIRSYQSLAMWDFESQIWNDFGRVRCGEKGHNKIINWTTAERYNYHCHVNAKGEFCYKGPFLNKAATRLQKTVGDENVLIVKFMEQETVNIGTDSILRNPVFDMVVEDGIFVGRKRYRFFVNKDGGKGEKQKDPTSSPIKCYFVCFEGFATLLGKPPHLLDHMSVHEARCLFMHIHKVTSLSLYMLRFSLILSKTITLDLDFNVVQVKVIDDEFCLDEHGEIVYDKNKKPMILTDGTGFISENLALRCPHNCYNGCVNIEEDVQELQSKTLEAYRFPLKFSESRDFKALPGVPPLLIQFRMLHKGRAVKGTVLVNRKLPPNTIQVRHSMLKVDHDEKLSGVPTVNAFDIVATSNKPKDAGLSKNLIALLHYGGVPKSFFLDLLWDALAKPLAVLHKTKAAVRVAVNWDFTDEYIAARMIASGIPLDEPFLKHRLSEIAKEEMKSLKAGKLACRDSFYLMGTADPTGILNSGEVCVILDQGQISGPMLVYRNPGLHSGDIHVVNARYIESLKEFVGNSKYGIFFPSKGQRSMADEIAGGDYDGDMYWVSTNAELLKYFRPSEPWKSKSRLKATNRIDVPTAEALEQRLFRSFLMTRFNPDYAMGTAADSWLMYMDRLLTLGEESKDEKIIVMKKIDELIDLYYDALDAPKKGNKVEIDKSLKPSHFPHYMGKGEHRTYTSKSILGEIHDLVDQLRAPIKFWRLECFKAEIPETCLNSWRDHYTNYRFEITNALRAPDNSKKAAAVYEKYRKMLYGGVDDLDSSEKPWNQIRLEALAIYHVCYDYAELKKDPRKCGFAWRVAGDALWKIHVKSKGEKPIWFAPSVLGQMTR